MKRFIFNEQGCFINLYYIVCTIKYIMFTIPGDNEKLAYLMCSVRVSYYILFYLNIGFIKLYGLVYSSLYLITN